MRKKLNNRCPLLVALTANAFHGAREEYLAMGFDDYLSKPILPPALRQLITRAGKTLSPTSMPQSQDERCCKYAPLPKSAGARPRFRTFSPCLSLILSSFGDSEHLPRINNWDNLT